MELGDLGIPRNASHQFRHGKDEGTEGWGRRPGLGGKRPRRGPSTPHSWAARAWTPWLDPALFTDSSQTGAGGGKLQLGVMH